MVFMAEIPNGLLPRTAALSNGISYGFTRSSLTNRGLATGTAFNSLGNAFVGWVVD